MSWGTYEGSLAFYGKGYIIVIRNHVKTPFEKKLDELILAVKDAAITAKWREKNE